MALMASSFIKARKSKIERKEEVKQSLGSVVL
jgi:hypothetical protein